MFNALTPDPHPDAKSKKLKSAVLTIVNCRSAKHPTEGAVGKKPEGTRM